MMSKVSLSRRDGRWSLCIPQMVSLHTARRTFITNIYLSGKFSVEFMMKLSGHKKYDTFKKYVRLSAEEYADDIAKSAEHCLF